MRAGFTAIVAILLVASTDAAQAFKWWQSEEVQRDLHLTPQQVIAIEEIYQTTLPERRALRLDLDRLEAELQQRLDASDADEGEVAALIDHVEAARARRNVARTMMLFRMQKLLGPEQRAGLARRAARGR